MKPLLDLDPRDCRWPVTDTKPFMFCAAPRDGESSYCACHRVMSVTPDQPPPMNGRHADFLAGGRVRQKQYAHRAESRMRVDTRIACATSANRTAWGNE